MLPHKSLNLHRILLCIILLVSSKVFAQMKIAYGIPEGFSAVEMDNAARFVANYNGRTLPGFISYSLEQGVLIFDSAQYRENGVAVEDLRKIRSVLAEVNYKKCSNGCDLRVADHYVILDKARRALTIRSAQEDYISPTTSWGLINNQSLDLRGSSDGYRALNVNGNTWMGMPGRSFGYMNWYASHGRSRNFKSSSDQGISSYFLQKNFAQTYVRAGKQDRVDYSSGSVSTVLSPGFDQFFTLGSQGNLRSNRDVGSLVLFSSAEGNYEFYRNGRLVLKRPAALGRNEISFIDLPGGYYPIEIRLVDRNGSVVSRETQDVNNLSFTGQGDNAWRVTAGKDMQEGKQLFEAAMSRNFSQIYLNSATVTNDSSTWATELNLSRPTTVGSFNLSPTAGMLAGERGSGGYINLDVSDDGLGSLMVSRYASSDISRLYSGAPSTSLSYSKNLGGVLVAYNYRNFSRGATHQTEMRWNYRPNGLLSTFSLGVQKGGSIAGDSDYTLYVNMSWALERSEASLNAAQFGNQTQVTGDYRKSFQDTYGTSSSGLTVNHSNGMNSINAYSSRSGTRGDASLNVGHGDYANNLDFNYRGMLAANSQGMALGRYSNSGSAMLLETPDLQSTSYGFSVEGHPVAGGSTYAVPLDKYHDVPFARVVSDSADMDMNIEVPANIIRAHPGQVYNAKAKVDINMVYSGILQDASGRPVGGRILETGDTAYPNGLFSITHKAVLNSITVEQTGRQYHCDLTRNLTGSYYPCQ
ncbi:TcfC E-set like domain-containing protein [Pseudomonas sp. 1912-s]|uniref:TcfC E-set like domain-containing protein n=1 Tax=Pseudomonas sp. 1912-s TaxID=3033802 RepID=UPI0023DF359A|nr:TcfC E-set like domain-containing protein [Pseudomonas sp. 1912-s]MDF3202857.1 TcfC E-set like domain-containing protein [Pseudomonas sp. 1912-s]